MMNYFDFNEDDRKKLFKLVTEKEYKKTPRRFHPPKTAITKIFKTTDMSRVDFKDLKKYVEQNYFAYNDNFVIFYGGMLDRKLEELFYFHGEFKVLLKDTEYKDLNEEQKDLIEKHREEYNQEGISLDYDKYILFMCKPNELSFERIRSEKAIEYLDTIKKEKEALEEKYNNEILKNNELQKNLKSCEGRIVKLQSLLSDYEKRFSVDNTVLILKDLLPHDFQAKSYEEVYKQLTVQEKKSFDDNDYRLCKQILAAKYMILEIM